MSSECIACCKNQPEEERMPNRFFFSLTILMLIPLHLTAGEKDKSQDLKYTITVTANRIETPLEEVASSITVITKEELERLKKTTVLEVLEAIQGLNVIQNGPPGAAASVFIRGAKSENTKVLLDGMELNEPMTPGRSFDMSHILVENIDRIEIIKGPQSTLYGSDAVGGIINIITRQERGKPRFHVSAQGGSYGTLSSYADVSGGSEKIAYSFGAAYLRSDGFSASSTTYTGNQETDGYRNFTLSGKLSLKIQDNHEISFHVRTIDAQAEIDNFGGDYGDDPNHVMDYTSSLLKGSYRGLFFRNRMESKINLVYITHYRNFDNPEDNHHPLENSTSEFKSHLFKLSWENNLFVHEANTISLGFDYSQESGESESFSQDSWGSFSSTFPQQEANNTGIFIQDKIRVNGQFFATVGIRFDHHSQAESALTFRVAPGYSIEETGTRIRGSLGTGFKAPTLYQLYAPGTVFGPIGNEGLAPEKSIGWDAGIDQGFFQDRLSLSLTYFYSQYRDLIDFDFVQGFSNVKEASSRGTEVSISSHPVDILKIMVTYTRNKAVDEETGEFLLRRPQEKYTADLYLNFPKHAHFSVSLLHTGKSEDLFFIGWSAKRVEIPGFTLLNLTLSYDLSPNLKPFLRFNNLLDEKYEMIKGFGTPGFSMYGGVKLDF